jgi:hypothetical protein
MSPPAFRATFPGVAYQVGNVRILVAVYPASKPNWHIVVRWYQRLQRRLKLVSCIWRGGLFIVNWFPVLVGGDHFKTYIIEKGKEVQVPNYATVLAWTAVDHEIWFVDLIVLAGPRNLDRCRSCLCVIHHNHRTRVRTFYSPGRPDLLLTYIHLAGTMLRTSRRLKRHLKRELEMMSSKSTKFLGRKCPMTTRKRVSSTSTMFK